MRIEKTHTDDLILKELGARLARWRLDQDMTQAMLAKQAGLGVRTVQRLERGEVATQLAGFIRVCRVLGLVERLELMVPEPLPNPMEQLKLRGRQRQRASGFPPMILCEGQNPKPWTWGTSE